jgi:hypothetical protein
MDRHLTYPGWILELPCLALRWTAVLAFVALGGCATAATLPSRSGIVDVSQLISKCGAPGRCDHVLACEGQLISVKGTIDPANVFDHRRYPSMPYEKLTLADRLSGDSIEVWGMKSRGESLFTVLEPFRNQPVGAIIHGRPVGVDLPITGRCIRVIRLEINSSMDLTVGIAE